MSEGDGAFWPLPLAKMAAMESDGTVSCIAQWPRREFSEAKSVIISSSALHRSTNQYSLGKTPGRIMINLSPM